MGRVGSAEPLTCTARNDLPLIEPSKRSGLLPAIPAPPYNGPIEVKDAAGKDGMFVVRAHSNSGASLTTNVKVDGTPPTISALVDGAALSTDSADPTVVLAFAPGAVALSCLDATSGIATSDITVFPGIVGIDSCGGTGALNTGAPKGLRTITATATDVAGNEVTTSFYATIKDTVPPIVKITAGKLSDTEATSADGAIVFVGVEVTGTDAIDGRVAVACTKPDGTVVSLGGNQQFAFGTTIVTCTATDSSGNRGTGTFTVTVVDTTAPVLTVPSNMTVNATSTLGAVVTYSATATATDDVTAVPIVTCMPASGSTFVLGTTTVSCFAQDLPGINLSLPQSFTVTVVRPFRYSGFYSPVNMDEISNPLGANGEGTVVNSVNGGRNVPLKFEVFENGVEITDVSRIEVDKVRSTRCAGKTVIPLSSNTSKAVLKFDGSQMSEGWATPKIARGGPAECWEVTVRVNFPTRDSAPGITAYFLVTP